MSIFSSLEARNKLDSEMSWEDRPKAATTYGMMSSVAERFGDRNAVTYQLTSGPTDAAETVTWGELHAQVTQAANLFRSLGVGENDVVAYLLPNANETVVALMGATVAGIANPINPLLEAEQIASILRETKAKVLVTLQAFPKTDLPQKAAEAVKMAPNVETVLEVDLKRYLSPPKSWLVSLVRPKNPISHNA
ncbi:MAG: AMP-binding protein, partial [Silicimonas sp.]|nr:AMP-binding protein [Silicimonas sp.]